MKRLASMIFAVSLLAASPAYAVAQRGSEAQQPEAKGQGRSGDEARDYTSLIRSVFAPITDQLNLTSVNHINALHITEPVEERVALHGRPYLIIRAGRFADKIFERITDKNLKKMQLPKGSVNQFVDSTEQLSHPELGKKLKVLYE